MVPSSRIYAQEYATEGTRIMADEKALHMSLNLGRYQLLSGFRIYSGNCWSLSMSFLATPPGSLCERHTAARCNRQVIVERKTGQVQCCVEKKARTIGSESMALFRPNDTRSVNITRYAEGGERPALSTSSYVRKRSRRLESYQRRRRSSVAGRRALNLPAY